MGIFLGKLSRLQSKKKRKGWKAFYRERKWTTEKYWIKTNQTENDIRVDISKEAYFQIVNLLQKSNCSLYFSLLSKNNSKNIVFILS